MSRSEYPSDWGTVRKRAYKRDDYQCQNCGRRGGPYGNAELHAHHIVPKAKGGTHQLDNLQTLCSACHNAVHTDSMAPTADREQPEQLGTWEQIRRAFFRYVLQECLLCGGTRTEIDLNTLDHPVAFCTDCGIIYKCKINLEILKLQYTILDAQPERAEPRPTMDTPSELAGFTFEKPTWREIGERDELSLEILEEYREKRQAYEKKLTRRFVGVVIILLLSFVLGFVFNTSGFIILGGVFDIAFVCLYPYLSRRLREQIVTVEDPFK